MRPSRWLAAATLLAAGWAGAQPAGPAAGRAEIAESDDSPAPPALSLNRLMPLEVPGSGLSFGIDPASVTVRDDRIVRYVVVARSAGGALNAMFEGLRCETGEYRVYARHSGRGEWQAVRAAEWRSVYSDRGARHTLAFAKAGACMDQTVAGTPDQILRNLAQPPAQRFR